MFLKEEMFTVVTHVNVGGFPLGKSTVIYDNMIFGTAPGSCQIFSNIKSRDVEING